MNKQTVITIGREFGSGGREIGERLARDLGIPFYDKELIALAAEKSGMSQEYLKEADEKPTNSLLYSLSTGFSLLGRAASPAYSMPITDKLFILQSDLIKQAAEQGSCVIVGRCADYILSDHPSCVHIFLRAELPLRIARCMKLYDLTKEKAEELITKTDKKRASYYNYYSGNKWGDLKNYHLCIDTGAVGIENTVRLIESFLEMKAANEAAKG